VTKTAQVELKRGRVYAPGRGHGLNIRGAGTAPAVFSCKIGTHGRDNVAVTDWAEPLLLACEIAGSPASGVTFATGGRASHHPNP
jgi:hypothetical protein